MGKIKTVKFMSNDRYEDMLSPDTDNLYAVDWYDFTVSVTNPAASQVYVLKLPKTINPKHYHVKAYLFFHSPVHNFVKGDVVPLEFVYGNAYRNISYTYNESELYFPTSNQLSVINKNTADSGVSVQGNYTTVYFDFYKLR